MKRSVRTGFEVLLLVVAAGIWAVNIQRITNPRPSTQVAHTRALSPVFAALRYPWQDAVLPRLPSVVQEPQPAPSRAAPGRRPPVPILRGVLGSGPAGAVLLAESDRAAVRLVRVGDDVNGWRVVRIEARGVVLAWRGQTRDLLLAGPGGSRR